MNLFSCKNLFVSYGEKSVIENLSFTVREGDYVFIVGENGCGKSTLMKTILGLKAKDGGEIVFENLKKSEIGYLPQKSATQKDFPATVEEVVFSGCCNSLKIFPFYGEKQKRKVLKVFDIFGLNSLKNVSFKDLSKGQQQKVLIARAFCACGKILFLDEPCSSLDPIFAREFYVFLKKMNEEENVAVVMISHDVKAAIKNAKKILHIEKNATFFGEVFEYLKTKAAKSFLEGE